MLKINLIERLLKVRKGEFFVADQGSVLIQLVLISLGVSITSVFLINQIQVEKLQSIFFRQKIDNLLLQNTIENSLAVDLNVCNWQLRNRRLDGRNIGKGQISPTILRFNQLYLGLDNRSPVLAQSGRKLTNSNLVVDRITFEEITGVGFENLFSGKLKIWFRSSTGNLVPRPLAITEFISTNPADNPRSQRIVACLNGPRLGIIPVLLTHLARFQTRIDNQ